MTTTINLKRSDCQILTSRIFVKILYKINYCNKKGNQKFLSIDLLKQEVQKDLLFIVVHQVEEIYTKLLDKKDPKLFMQKNGKALFLNCIKKSCEAFLTKQYGYQVTINSSILKQSLYTKTLLKDRKLLFQYPFYFLLDPESELFRFVYYPVYNSASESFIEALLDNIIFEISNCVVYFNVVKFSSVYAFRQTLYRSNFLSLRNFERFKNNLNWDLITKNYIRRPVDIYNNRYPITVLRSNGIYHRIIYTNWSKEINYLTNFSLVTLIVIESKDFIASRLNETIYFVSKGLRVTFTSVLGQVIGLIWRGIIEGLKK